MDLKTKIRAIENFPKEGVTFRDITPILKDPECLNVAIDRIIESVTDQEFSLVLGPESRGFIFGVPVSCKINKGFIPVRKAGKLPYETISKSYSLEYGEATIEMHVDAIEKGDKVIIIDDLLATGGTAKAIAELVEQIGATVSCIVFLIELEGLQGRKNLEGYDVRSIIKY